MLTINCLLKQANGDANTKIVIAHDAEGNSYSSDPGIDTGVIFKDGEILDKDDFTKKEWSELNKTNSVMVIYPD